MGYSSSDGLCELVSSVDAKLQDRKGSVVVLKMCFEVDLDELE